MHVLRFDSEAAWVGGVCAFWRDRLRTNPRLRMCLPTGLTPVGIYAEMVRSASFADATIFALDEFGGLAPDDPGRTRRTLERLLIGAAEPPAPAFHFLDPDDPDLAARCRAYEAAMGEGFDLVLLGVGANGHLGMNEPGSAEDSPTRRVDLHPQTIRASSRYFAHQNLPTWGLTVGLRAILAAREVWLLANGSGKAEIVKRTLDDAISPDNPASLLRRHPNCSLFVDGEAGRLLS